MNKQAVVTKSVTYTLPLFPIFVVLLVLKLLGIIDIGWFWVFLPILIGPIFALAVIGFMLVCLIFAALVALVVGIFS